MMSQGKQALFTQWKAEQGIYTVSSPHVCGMFGRISGKRDIGVVSMDVAPLDGNGHGSLMLVSLDGRPLEFSNKMLLTVMRRAENEGMRWNAERTSVGRDWGSGPVRVLGLTARVETPGREATVTKLSSACEPMGEGSLVTTVTVKPSDKTIWYLLTR